MTYPIKSDKTSKDFSFTVGKTYTYLGESCSSFTKGYSYVCVKYTTGHTKYLVDNKGVLGALSNDNSIYSSDWVED